MEYTVCLLFTPDGKSLVLQKKNKAEFAGLLNGVGGKVELGETSLDCALREIEEETNLRLEWLYWLGELRLPRDCGLSTMTDCSLWFYAGVVCHPEDLRQVEDEPVMWVDVQSILEHPEKLAGDGDLPYFINQGIRALRGGGYRVGSFKQ